MKQKADFHIESTEATKRKEINHEGLEENEGKPGNSALRSGIIDFAVPGNNSLFAVETRTVPVSPLYPSSRTYNAKTV